MHPTLPPKLQKAAKYLLDHPAKIATESMRTIARKSGVGLPNFSRLAQAVGFQKYSDMKNIYREHFQQTGPESYHERALRLQQSGNASGDDEVWSSFREAALDNVDAVFNKIDSSEIGFIADQLLTKDRIYVAGMQSSHAFARYFHYVGGMVLPAARLLGHEGDSVADSLFEISSSDALVSISMQPCATATVKAMEIAKSRGVFVVGITDSRTSPMAAFCDEVLITSVRNPLFFESYVGTVAVIELLIGFLTIRSEENIVDRITLIEEGRRLFGEYWPTADGDNKL